MTDRVKLTINEAALRGVAEQAAQRAREVVQRAFDEFAVSQQGEPQERIEATIAAWWQRSIGKPIDPDTCSRLAAEFRAGRTVKATDGGLI